MCWVLFAGGDVHLRVEGAIGAIARKGFQRCPFAYRREVTASPRQVFRLERSVVIGTNAEDYPTRKGHIRCDMQQCKEKKKVAGSGSSHWPGSLGLLSACTPKDLRQQGGARSRAEGTLAWHPDFTPLEIIPKRLPRGLPVLRG